MSRHPLAVAAACSTGLGLVMLDNTSVGLALPAMRADLDTEVAGLQWVTAVIALGTAASLPLSGAAGDRLGPRRVARAGLLLFAVAAAVSALATSVAVLVAVRAVAGVAVALVLPNTAALLAANVPGDQRSRAVGAWISFGSLGLVTGPLLGGLLVDGPGWRAVFLSPVAVALAGVAALAPLHDPPAETGGRVDVAGVLTSSAAVLCVSFALIELGREQRRLGLALATLAAGALLLVAFARAERRASTPLLDPALLRDWRYPALLVASLTYNAAVGGGFFVVALLLQSGLGLTASAAGFVLLGATIGMPVGGQLSSRVQQRFGLRRLLVGAIALLAASYTLATALADAAVVLLALALCLGGLAMGLLFAADTLAVLDIVSAEKSSSGLASLSLARQTGTVVGVAGLGAVAEVSRIATGDELAGLRWALATAAVIVVPAGVVLGRALRPRASAATAVAGVRP